MPQINLATEDELSEAVALRLIAEQPTLEVGLLLRRGGNGYLFSNLPAFREMARRVPMLLMTDLDMTGCAPAFIARWIGDRGLPRNLLLRVVVREVEAWLLSDHDAIVEMMGGRVAGQLIAQPELLLQPKEALLELARKAHRDVRGDLLPTRGSDVKQGLGYNVRLIDFVNNHWDPERASARSDSLSRARIRLRDLAERL